MNDNLQAFLDVIATSEGTINVGDDGYNVLVGGGLFSSYADHPRVSVYLAHLGIHSTAAGRYQILEHYYDTYKVQLDLPDFDHESQDKIALQMIHECKATDDIVSGNFDEAVKKCCSRWASFPGANYGQHENKIETLRDVYVKSGGALN